MPGADDAVADESELMRGGGQLQGKSQTVLITDAGNHAVRQYDPESGMNAHSFTELTTVSLYFHFVVCSVCVYLLVLFSCQNWFGRYLCMIHLG